MNVFWYWLNLVAWTKGCCCCCCT